MSHIRTKPGAPLVREYPPEALTRIRLIKQAQALGLTLAEIAGLLTLRPRAEVTYADMEARIRSEIADIDSKLTALTRLRGSLERLLCECCHSQHTARECPALGKHAST